MQNVCAVVVTYHPDRPVLENLIASIKQQIKFLVVVDNASDPHEISWLAQVPHVHLIKFPENRGLGAAHNAGIVYAMKQMCKYVLLLDQDSEACPDMVKNLVHAHQQLQQLHPVAAVGPRYVDSSTGHLSRFVRVGALSFRECIPTENNGCPEVDFLISSGALITLKAVQDVGMMDEGLFIDHVDTEWCLRARNKKWRLHGVTSALMKHSLGEGCVQLNWPRKRRIALYSPLRHYYICRNSIALIKRSDTPWRWKLNISVRLLLVLLFFIAFMAERRTRLSYVSAGFCDAVRGITGKCEKN